MQINLCIVSKMKKCCNNSKKYFIEYTKRNDNELKWSLCDEHFQKEEFRKNVKRIQTVSN